MTAPLPPGRVRPASPQPGNRDDDMCATCGRYGQHARWCTHRDPPSPSAGQGPSAGEADETCDCEHGPDLHDEHGRCWHTDQSGDEDCGCSQYRPTPSPSEGQDTEQLRDEIAGLAEQWQAESAEAMKTADAARERGDRTMYAVNVRHARVIAHAATDLRRALDGPQHGDRPC